LEDHSDSATDLYRIDLLVVQVDSVIHDLALNTRCLDQVIHSIQTPEEGGFSAT
jgi:hypothetical protein